VKTNQLAGSGVFGKQGAFRGMKFSSGAAVEPTLLVIGLNHRTAPLAVRERFWISESRRVEALVQLPRLRALKK
jgi:hypothetical protein